MRRNDSAMDTRGLSLMGEDSGISGNLDLHVLGICTGSGLVELDFALLHYRQHAPYTAFQIVMKEYCQLPVHHSIRTPTLNLLNGAQAKPAVTGRLDALLGRMFSEGIEAFCRTRNIDIANIDITGIHAPGLGRPTPRASREPGHHLSDWISITRNETGRTVGSNFSVQEAHSTVSPVAFVDGLLLRHSRKFRACIDIDEIININFIPPFSEKMPRRTVSRDCGPGSLLINYAMKYCTSNDQGEDNDGTFAAGGKVNEAIVDRYLAAYDYQFIQPPLSIAREMFGDHEAQRLIDECLFSQMSEPDTVATATRITARNIVTQYHRLLEGHFPRDTKVDELFICGPGAQNSCIIDFLELELPESVVTKPLDDIGIPGEANKALCYAHLALESVLSQITQSYRNSTSHEVEPPSVAVRGTIVHGENWSTLHDKLSWLSKGRSTNETKDIRVVESLSDRMLNGFCNSNSSRA